jgi:hypothetical protein
MAWRAGVESGVTVKAHIVSSGKEYTSLMLQIEKVF